MVAMYRSIWRVSGRRQILLILLAVIVASIAAAPFKFQQLVINALIEGTDRDRLSWLCAGFLGVVLLSAGLKFALGLGVAAVGEGVVLRIRERLYGNAVAAAGEDPERRGQGGSLLTMLSAEAEAVGAFVGGAIAMPLVQLGTLVSVVSFIAANQPRLGLLVAVVILPQAIIVVGLQRRINREVRERVQALRDASGRIAAGGLREFDAAVGADFHRAYLARRRSFVLKQGSKLALGGISAVGAALILLAGGSLVLDGRSDVGIVVASLTGLARIQAPWREFVAFFRSLSAVRVQYAMLQPALYGIAPERSASRPR